MQIEELVSFKIRRKHYKRAFEWEQICGYLPVECKKQKYRRPWKFKGVHRLCGPAALDYRQFLHLARFLRTHVSWVKLVLLNYMGQDVYLFNHVKKFYGQ